MRDWTKLRPAYFRGIFFRVDDDGPDVGRRVAVHEISGGEMPVTEDMGRRAEPMLVSAYVAGDDADAAALRLEAACRMPGPGLLVLPIDPPRMMHCLSCRRDRRKDRNGLIKLRLEFVEAGHGGAGLSSPIGALRTVFDAGAAAAARALGLLSS